MKIFVVIALILISSFSSVSAHEYSPYVEIKNYSTEDRSFSGVVIEQGILTCAHGFEDQKPNPKVIISSGIYSVKLNAKIVKINIDVDLCLLSVQIPKDVSVKPLKIATRDLKVGDIAISHGVITDPIMSNMTVSNLTGKNNVGYYGSNGEPLTHCYGSVQSGMSGGPLEKDTEVFGILSTSTKHPGGLYASRKQIEKFLRIEQ